MKFILKITSLFMSLLFALSGISESVIGYTEGDPIEATKIDYCFDDDRLLIGAYYAEAGKMDKAKEAGIDFFIDNRVTKEFLDECQRYSIGVIAGGYNYPQSYADFSDEKLATWLSRTKEQYKDHPALWGDDMIDEPGANSFDNLAKAVDGYIKTTEGMGKLPLINLFPSYANEEQLQEKSDLNLFQKILLFVTGCGNTNVDSYKKHVSDYINKIDTDYICVDIYPMRFTRNEDKVLKKETIGGWLRNLDILAEACRETNRKMWVITQASGQEIEEENGGPRWCDEVSDISQQAYASLAFGAGAVIHALFAPRGWWDAGQSHMIATDGSTTETFDAVKAVDTDLHSFADVYGKYTYSSTYMINKRKVAGFDSGKLATEKSEDVINIRSKNGLLVGAFKGDDGNAYVIANMEELEKQVTASVKYTVPDGKTAVIYQGGEHKTYAAGKTAELSLQPGEGVFITVK